MIDFKFIDLEEAAKLLGINKVILQRAIRAGELEAVRLGNGNNYKVTELALQRWVQSRTVNAPAQSA